MIEPRTSRVSAGEVGGEFEEREDWNPAPEEDFLRDSLEIVDLDDGSDDGSDDAEWA